MEKPLDTVLVGPKVGWGRASGNHQGGENSVSQVDGVSDMAPTCQLWAVGGVLRKGVMAPANTSVWDKAAPQLLA